MPDRILVTEDDPLVLRALQMLLERENMEAVGVPTAEEALKSLHGGSYDLVLVDVGLPGMSGLELLADIREQFPQLPTIVITGNPTLNAARQAIQLGARDFFQKPLLGPEVLDSIQTLLADAREQRVRTHARELTMGNRMAVNLCNHFNNLLGARHRTLIHAC